MDRKGLRYWLKFGAFTLGFVVLSIASVVVLGLYAFSVEFDSGEPTPASSVFRALGFAIYFPASLLMLSERSREFLSAADERFLLFLAIGALANSLLWWRVLGLVRRRRQRSASAAIHAP